MKTVRTILRACLLTGTLALGLTACGSGGNSTSAGGTAVAYATSSWADLNIASGDQQVTLSWTDNINPATATSKTTYNVYFAKSAGVKPNGTGVTKVGIGTDTTFIHTGLTNGTSYYYVVTAVSSSGSEGVVSKEASAMPQAALPAAPTGITISSQNNLPSLNLTQITGLTYNVYWSTATFAKATDTGVNKVPGVSFPFTPSLVPAAGNGTTFYFVVTSQRGTIESLFSKQITWTPSLITATSSTNYGSPTGITALAGNQQVNLSWTAPSTPASLPDGSSLTYSVNWWMGGEAKGAHQPISNLTSTSFTHQSLSNGTQYYYSVTAVQTGTSPSTYDSATLSVTPEAKAPAVPSGLSAAAQSQQVNLAWTKDNSGDAVSYNLYWSTDDSTWSKISNISSNAYTQTGLQSGVTYFYKVSCQGAGESNYSNIVSATP